MSPVALPSGVLPRPVEIMQGGELVESRVTGYRVDLLDRRDRMTGTLEGVQGGTLDWSQFTAIKGGGTIDVDDRGQQIDWLNVRLRPVVSITSVDGTRTEHPAGVFLPSAPVEDWTATGRSWKVELLDKCAILDQDVVTDLNGNPVVFVAPAGANVIATVVSLIEATGETTPAIEPDSKTLLASLTWDVGTPILTIVNELLEASGYASLWVDGQGQFRVTPFVAPGDRVPIYEALAPFTKGETSVLAPDWQRDRDIYQIPNRYVAVSQGDGEEEGMVAVVTNEDPASPFSYQSRGRWITRTVTGVEATSQADLEARAVMGLAQASSIASGLKIKHLFLPDLMVTAAVRFKHPDAGLDVLCYVTKTTLPLDPLALCASEIREAL